jgi:glycosyltransferase involved in cell wall biosynthesis
MIIAIIAPIAPFRGGIARHSQRLAKQLVDDGHEVRLFSFARLYPKLLYPGADDRDPAASPPDFGAPDYGIDSINPLSWQRTAERVIASGARVAVIPSWTFFVAPALGWIARVLQRRGVRVIQIVHNAADHEGAAWKSAVQAYQLRAAERYVVHNQPSAEVLRRDRPGRDIVTTPHPIYDDYPPPQPAAEHPPGGPIRLLVFGLVRRYKGVDIAVDALGKVMRIGGAPAVHLTIAGEFWEDEALIRAAVAREALTDQVTIHASYVSDQMASDLFAACDALLLPYRSATGSGVIAMAQHFAKPVLASDIPSLHEAIGEGETGLLFAPDDSDALAQLLAALSRERLTAMAPALAAQRAALGWDRFAAAMLAGINP